MNHAPLLKSWAAMMLVLIGTGVVVGLHLVASKPLAAAIFAAAALFKGCLILLDYLELRGSPPWQRTFVAALFLLLLVLTILGSAG